MFAYGTEECAPANMVTGPGNIWVAAAKRYFTGRIGIDTEAGPTEIAILADESADPVHVAADLISQAEHDPMAAAVLVTDSTELADAVEKELEPQIAATKHVEDRIVPALSGRQSAIVLVDGVEEGLRVVNAYGAEHLEIQTADAAAVAARVRNSRRDLRRPLGAGLARRLLQPARTMSCPPAAAPATPPVSPSSPSCAASTSWTTRETRSPRSPITS